MLGSVRRTRVDMVSSHTQHLQREMPSKSFQSTRKIKNIQGHFIGGKKEAEKAGAAEV